MPPRFHLKTTRLNISDEMLPPLLPIPASLSSSPLFTLSLSLFIAKKKYMYIFAAKVYVITEEASQCFGLYTLVWTRASTLARGAERVRCLQLERRRCLADEEKK